MPDGTNPFGPPRPASAAGAGSNKALSRPNLGESPETVAATIDQTIETIDPTPPRQRKTKVAKISGSLPESVAPDPLLDTLPQAWRELLMHGDEAALAKLDAKLAEAEANKQLELFSPSAKQKEYFDAGAHHHIRMFRAGNRSGKTHATTYECCLHATGRYPPWWTGKRFDKPGTYWVLCETSELTRDVLQTKMIGPYARREDWGKNCFIPRELLDVDNVLMRHGVPGAIDTISVKHISGGWSQIQFKASSFGRERLQGGACMGVVIDEEPPLEVATECATRIATTNGVLLISMTPLSGRTQLVEEFEAGNIGRMITATLYDAAKSRGGHLEDAEIDRLISSWPEHERLARIQGIPFLGSGLVYPISESSITCAPFEIPGHWKQIGGIDFGTTDYAAFARIAWDDPALGGSDCMYVVACHRSRDSTPMAHAAAVMPWGRDLVWSWPHDGNRRSITGAGDALMTFKAMYEQHGFQMLGQHATNLAGGNNKEQSTAALLERMQTGRFKVFSTLGDVLNDLRMYSRQSGVLDHEPDLLSAIRYACMMASRYAAVPSNGGWGTGGGRGALKRNIRGIV